MKNNNLNIWAENWPDEILNSPELASRRKRSHSLNLISLNRSKPEAVFLSDSKDERLKGNTYITNLTKCTCTDFLRGHGKRPCKHIFRLAEELELFQNEYFLSGEHDYTMKNSSYEAGNKKIPQNGVYSCDFIWRTRWEHEILYSFELASRRKFSHLVNILSIDKEKIEAICQDSDITKTYVTTLTNCTCEDYKLGFGIRPCKHIFRLAEELNLIQCEYDILADYGNDIKLDFNELDDSKASQKRKRLIFQEWKELLYGFNSAEEGINFIKNLKLTVQQLKEFSKSSKFNIVFSGRKKAEIIENIVAGTTGHAHRQLLRWLADQIYKYNDIEECKEFLLGLKLTIPQIIEFAEFKHIELSGSNETELIENIVANTVGKKAINGGNVITVSLDFDINKSKIFREICEKENLLQINEEQDIENTNADEIEIYNKNQEEITETEKTIEQEAIETQIEAIPVSREQKKLSKTTILLKLIKYFISCFMFFWAVLFMVGTISRAKIAPRELLIPFLMCVLGSIIAISAKRKKLEGTMLKWLIYGTFVPVVSWMDILKAYSDGGNKLKIFLKNLLFCIIGIIIWMSIFSVIIEPQKTRKNQQQQIHKVERETKNEQR